MLSTDLRSSGETPFFKQAIDNFHDVAKANGALVRNPQASPLSLNTDRQYSDHSRSWRRQRPIRPPRIPPSVVNPRGARRLHQRDYRRCQREVLRHLFPVVLKNH